jgi:HD-GYP domain-containing protein (c-di-GMP phosphodiesterase class II)
MFLNLSQTELDDIYLSSLLHDLGKIGIDDRILSKTGKLTADEFRQIQQHPLIGYEILSPIKSLSSILPGVRSHHEAYNGKGYPDGLSGEDIPLMARIIAVADSYDAMASDRPYRDGMPLSILEDIFRRGSGEQWDPKVIEAYFAVRDEICTLSQSYTLNDGNLLDTLTVSQSAVFQLRAMESTATAAAPA